MKFAPIPCILCVPAFPVDNNGDRSGSTAIILISFFCFFKKRPVPVSVPPVPTPATKTSMQPSVSRHISGPVVSICACTFAGLSN